MTELRLSCRLHGLLFFGGLQLNQKLIAFAYTAAAAAAAAKLLPSSLSVAAAHHGCGFQRLAVSTFNQSQQKKGPTVVYCTSSNFLAAAAAKAATAGVASGCWTVGAQALQRIYIAVYIYIYQYMASSRGILIYMANARAGYAFLHAATATVAGNSN